MLNLISGGCKCFALLHDFGTLILPLHFYHNLSSLSSQKQCKSCSAYSTVSTGLAIHTVGGHLYSTTPEGRLVEKKKMPRTVVLVKPSPTVAMAFDVEGKLKLCAPSRHK